MTAALVLTSGEGHAALAATRGLAAGGWRVGVGGPRTSVASFSRHVFRRHEIPAPETDWAAFLESAGRATADGNYDVLFGCGDDWVMALALAVGDLAAVVAHPDGDAVMRALDKLEIVTVGRAVGLATPRTVLADEPDGRAWQGPAAVKARRHWIPGSRASRRFEAAILDGEAITRRVEEIRASGGQAVLQEPVKGRLMSVIVLMVDGMAALTVQQVADSVFPTPAGVTARARTVAVDEALATKTEMLLAALGLDGLAQVEFVLTDPGTPLLVDVNPRFYGSMALAIRAGVNFPAAWADALVGRPVVTARAVPGVRYSWLEGDLRRAFRERRGGVRADVVDALRSSATADCGPLWSAGDPVPVAARPALAVVRRLRRG